MTKPPKISFEIRESFLQFFEKHGYVILPSGSLIPKNDPDLLFINSGMAPFKNYFLGQDKPAYKKWATCQKCMRAGGKHNDLEQIGYTNFHHTFFEMLGNFEINAQHPDEMIPIAWNFLTKELQIPESRLSVSVLDEDEDTARIWRKFLPESKIRKLGLADNFWQMGNTGPCGSCTEIFYTPEQESSHNIFFEIWNIVFIKYRLDEDRNRTDLPYVSIDTGMGLERITAVMQGEFDNYKTDLFKSSIRKVSDRCIAAGHIDRNDYEGGMAELQAQSFYNSFDYDKAKECDKISARIIVDHIRAATFLLAEGVVPTNTGRGYVLRRILRRAFLHMSNLVHVRPGYSPEDDKTYLLNLVSEICVPFGDRYPELENVDAFIDKIHEERERFAGIIEQAGKLLEKHLTDNPQVKKVDGNFIFTLYDTYGLPVEASRDICLKNNKEIDMAAFDVAMERQINLSRQARKQHSSPTLPNEVFKHLSSLPATDFCGFEPSRQRSPIVALIHGNKLCDELSVSEHLSYVIVAYTPFYAEAGGQVGDTGTITAEDGKFVVTDTVRWPDLPIIAHVGRVSSGTLRKGDLATLEIDAEKRSQIARNHSCVHLLSQILHNKFGAEQAGSWVGHDRFRFDFSASEKVTKNQNELEKLVNAKIWCNYSVVIKTMPLADAKREGVRLLKNEKYPDPVRVVTMSPTKGSFSREACGGTHVQSTADIGLFVIRNIESVAAGIQRIEGCTREFALAEMQNVRKQASQAAHIMHAKVADLSDQAQKLVSKQQAMQKDLQKLDMDILLSSCTRQAALSEQYTVQIRYQELHSQISFSGLAKTLQQKHPGIHIIFARKDDKYSVLINVNPHISDSGLSALQILQWMQDKLSVRGNGSDTLVQAGVKDLPWPISRVVDECLDFVLKSHKSVKMENVK